MFSLRGSLPPLFDSAPVLTLSLQHKPSSAIFFILLTVAPQQDLRLLHHPR
jgi:hypothetical protein